MSKKKQKKRKKQAADKAKARSKATQNSQSARVPKAASPLKRRPLAVDLDKEFDNYRLVSLIPWQEIEGEAQKQILHNLENPYLKKLVIMPDVHSGYDLPIGGVALLDEVVSPSYVGYDIGCGMVCVVTDKKADDVLPNEAARREFFERIYDTIPVGFASRPPLSPEEVEQYMPQWHKGGAEYRSLSGDRQLSQIIEQKLFTQLGTLGGGNHFIEIGADSQGRLAVTIHSGSRNMGHQIADYYMKKGRLLALNSALGRAYWRDMDFAIRFALANRRYMMAEVLRLLGFGKAEVSEFLGRRMINEAHNLAEIYENTEQRGILHRKGATPAGRGVWGVIPGNMRDGVYLTKGLGHKKYLESASHGAGRVMSRKQAQKGSLDDFAYAMRGVTARVAHSTLDEAPFSYKNIENVLQYQDGIVVEVVDKIVPLINVKG